MQPSTLVFKGHTVVKPSPEHEILDLQYGEVKPIFHKGADIYFKPAGTNMAISIPEMEAILIQMKERQP